MSNKQYSPALNKKYDRKGRDAVVEFFKQNHPTYTVIDNPNDKGIDQIVFDENKELKYIVEVEVRDKCAWKGRTFQWDTVTVPTRKKKLLNHPKYSTLFFSVNYLANEVLVTVAKHVLDSPIIRKKTCYSNNGVETFYNVPLSKFKQVRIK